MNTTSLEGALASWRGGFLGEAVCYSVQQMEIARSRIRSLQYHPARLFSFLDSQDYYAVKKRYLDWMASRRLQMGGFDFFHGWSGECFETLVEARLLGVPSVMDVPTWHRNKGAVKSTETLKERRARVADRGWRDWRKKLTVTRQQNLAEYDLADVLLMPSVKSAETFLTAGVDEKKLHYVGRGVDVERYRPGGPPEKFRVGFVGALIKRKGVHVLLEAWKKAGLKNAELVLVGNLHEEMKPYLEKFGTDDVRLAGVTNRVQDELRACVAFAFPSECEGFAKATLEAAACGLPLIATRESGDAVVDGETGLVIQPNDVEGLAAALVHAASHRDEMAEMGRMARKMVEERFTWDHYRARLLQGYAKAKRQVRVV
ncbi:glycosyltransferase family 4 protein [Phragmitibacter flavus]|uniref:Glycosyltransferase family 4 protein n=1 Tax=Phragmitibacter flavus TaxID=2576071 RepID=A0A5R8KEY3_9BACT|nr:glycosyltransferase family 4 protein [Phragmitibacter flavus]